MTVATNYSYMGQVNGNYLEESQYNASAMGGFGGCDVNDPRMSYAPASQQLQPCHWTNDNGGTPLVFDSIVCTGLNTAI